MQTYDWNIGVYHPLNDRTEAAEEMDAVIEGMNDSAAPGTTPLPDIPYLTGEWYMEEPELWGAYMSNKMMFLDKMYRTLLNDPAAFKAYDWEQNYMEMMCEVINIHHYKGEEVEVFELPKHLKEKMGYMGLSWNPANPPAKPKMEHPEYKRLILKPKHHEY